MMSISNRTLFLNHLAQTSPSPLALEIESAEGICLFDIHGKKYIDLISGISVSNVGHRHPTVVKAIEEQLKKYMHVMVYGEYVLSPQVKLAEALSKLLPPTLNSTYIVNSGAEAIEGSMKLAKRYTGRTEIISFKNAYHGSTQGALSIMGDEFFKNSFRPLLPDVKILEFNSSEALKNISNRTACIIMEPIQGEAGIVPGKQDFLNALRKRCDETGALLVFDEIQTGCGRTGTMFAFEKYNVVPDVLVLAKGLGGGMPIGTFTSSKEILSCLTNNPVLGHITTFGGHPVSCVAALATLNVLQSENLTASVPENEKLFHSLLQHSAIKQIRSAGLLFAVEFESEEMNKKVIEACISNGIITDWFLFNSTSMRIAPPLTINTEEIKLACELILKSIQQVVS